MDSVYVGLNYIEISGADLSPVRRVTLDSYDSIVFDLDHSSLLHDSDWAFHFDTDFSSYSALVRYWREELESALARGASVIAILSYEHGTSKCRNSEVLPGLSILRRVTGTAVRAATGDPYGERLISAAEAASFRFTFEGKIAFDGGSPLLYSGKSDSPVALRANVGFGTLFLLPRPSPLHDDGSAPIDLKWLVDTLSEDPQQRDSTPTAKDISDTVAAFLTQSHLYREIELDDIDVSLRLLKTWPSIEVFCRKCDAMRRFKPRYPYVAQQADSSSESIAHRTLELEYRCSAEEEHTLTYFLKMSATGIEKVGQTPSASDVQRPLPSRLRRRFPRDCEDIARARGLAAHGIGAGALLYLRRVIERQLARAESQTVKEGTATPQDLGKLRVSERFHALAPSLPPTIASDPTVYALLSAGVHELEEATCCEYFPVLHETVMHVLQEEAEAIESRVRAKSIKRRLAEVARNHAQSLNRVEEEE